MRREERQGGRGRRVEEENCNPMSCKVSEKCHDYLFYLFWNTFKMGISGENWQLKDIAILCEKVKDSSPIYKYRKKFECLIQRAGTREAIDSRPRFNLTFHPIE